MTPPPDRTRTEAEAAALELLRSSRRFVLSGHMRPDGDCVGAEAALAGVLRSLGKEVWILNPDPIEPQFDYLERENDFGVWSGANLPAHDVSVLLDCSELSRCGELGRALAEHPSKKLVVDHHIHTEGEWWDEAFVDVTASATGLLVYRIARALEVELDACSAAGVFTSLVTDTGWFKYSNTDAETLRVAGELAARGVDPNTLFGSIYQRRSREHPSHTARILGTTEYHCGGRLAVILSPRSEDGGAVAPDPDDALDLVRSVGTVEVVLYLRELARGNVKLSARSKTDYDVNALARRFGGGGHKKASGATIEGELEDVLESLVEAAAAGFTSAEGSAEGGGRL